MVKILAIGHSITAGRIDDEVTRPNSPDAPHLPEGGWWGGPEYFQVNPRWGTRGGVMHPYGILADGSPGWAVRATENLPIHSIQVWNEGCGGSKASDWDPNGGNFIGQIFTRNWEVLPNDITYATFQVMINDVIAGVTPAIWKAEVGRVIEYLAARGIQTILVKDWHYAPYATQLDALNTAVDELVAQYSLKPALDMRTVSTADWNGGKVLYNADTVHPNTKGHIVAGGIFADYLVANGIVTIPATVEECLYGIFDGAGTPITIGANLTFAKIRRAADGYLLDWNTGTFKGSAWQMIQMTLLEVDGVNLPGYYKKYFEPSGWADGWYQILTGYSGAPKSNGAIEFYVKGGKVLEVKTGENLDVAVSSRLAMAGYAAPDNAGIAAIQAEVVTHPTLAGIEASTVLAKQAKLDFMERWIINKLVEDPVGTWKLYDDDGVTVMKAWRWDAKTRTRELTL